MNNAPARIARVLILLVVLFALTTTLSRRGECRSRVDARQANPPAEPAAPTHVLDAGNTPLVDAAQLSEDARRSTPGPTDKTSIPRELGLPLRVQAGVLFQELRHFDDTKGEFEGTVDVRLRWTDHRLRFSPSEAPAGYKEYREEEAETQLAAMWAPATDIVNRIEADAFVGRRLRIFASGEVESLTRSSGRFFTEVDAQQFPFDRQHLRVELALRKTTTDEVLLQFEKDDVEFSTFTRKTLLEGWSLQFVELRADTTAGWNGDRHSKVRADLLVDRDPTTGLSPIFIPLVASLLIPLLTIWMNRATDEGFEVPGFELANMGIGGLFSVIALSFAVYSSYSMIAGSDNTVTRLFALNYAMLSLALAIIVVLFRHNLIHRLFGRHVHREAYVFLMWAMPVLALGTSIAFILIAAA